MVRLIHVGLILFGIGCIASAAAADWAGVGYPGFGQEQILLTLIGAGSLATGGALFLPPVRARLVRHSRLLMIGLVWMTILVSGVVGVELYARHLQGYLVWHWPLQRNSFSELDRLKLYNRRFVEERQPYFREWPIPLEVFEANQSTPRYRFKPNLRMARANNRLVPAGSDEPVFWSSNSLGLRGPELPVEKEAGLIRIVALGASTTEGSQTDDETYPVYLQQELDRLFPDQNIEVINAGHHGQMTGDLLEVLRRQVLPLTPDIVIFYQASNNIDVHDFINNLPCGLGECWLTQYGGVYRWLYKHSALFVLISDRLGWNNRRPSAMAHDFTEAGPKPSADKYKMQLRRVVQEVQAHQGIIVLSSFITVAHEGFEVDYRDNAYLFNDLYKKYYPLTPGELGLIYQHFNRQSAEVAREFGVPYADVAARFPKDPQYFPLDIIHFSPDGNRILARLFAEVLAEEVLPELMLN